MAANASPLARYTLEQYWVAEDASDLRSEFRAGSVLAMAGSSVQHAWITQNLVVSLSLALKGGSCRVGSGDMRVLAAVAQTVTYPDVFVACEPIELAPVKHATFTNPKIVIEVLSPSTERGDRGWKFKAYQTIPSFQQYVLVSQTAPFVEVFTRSAEGFWMYKFFDGLDAVAELSSIDVSLPLSEVYSRVEFPAIID
jgi:Uma2 family endonuclease